MSLRNTKSWMGFCQFVAVALVCLETPTAANAVPVLAEHFKFDETGTTTTAANSANAPNPGTLSGYGFDGDSKWTTGKIGGALEFDGSNDLVDIPTDRVYTNLTPWSVSFWYDKAADNNAGMVIGDPVNSADHIWLNVGGLLQYRNTPAPGFITTNVAGAAPMPGMHHITLTASGGTGLVTTDSTLKMYLDGAESFTSSTKNTSFAIAMIAHAYSPGTLRYRGVLDDIGVWSSELTPAEVTAIYQLADTAALNYDLGKAQLLFDGFDTSSPIVDIDGTFWRFVDDGSLGGSPGDVTAIGGGDFELNLGAGNGFTTLVPVPEPSSFLLLGLGALGLVRHTRRRRRDRASVSCHSISCSSRPLSLDRSVTMRKNQWCLGIATLVVSLLASGSTASAGLVSSNNFSLGYGFTDNTAKWNDSETSGANTGVVGDFTLSVTFDPNAAFTGGDGADFDGRVLANGSDGNSQGRSSTFGVSLTATYTGSVLADDTTLVIDSIRVYAANWIPSSVSNSPGADEINWMETTVGNIGASAPLDLGTGTNAASLASSYDQLLWNPGEVAITGITSTRDFSLGTNGVLNAYLDGFEVFGHIEVSNSIPEPSSFLLLGLGALGLVRHARRRRRRA